MITSVGSEFIIPSDEWNIASRLVAQIQPILTDVLLVSLARHGLLLPSPRTLIMLLHLNCGLLKVVLG